MTCLIRKGNGEIKTCMESAAGVVLEGGETLEEIPMPFGEYTRRLRVYVDGHAGGELTRIPAGSETINVIVECPGETAVRLDVNGLEEDLPLVAGRGMLTLSLAVPGMYIISPADRVKYCAAGEALCVVEVLE
jgi:hypothetical protein